MKKEQGHCIMIKESLYYNKKILHVLLITYIHQYTNRQNRPTRRYYNIEEETKRQRKEKKDILSSAEFKTSEEKKNRKALSEQCRNRKDNEYRKRLEFFQEN